MAKLTPGIGWSEARGSVGSVTYCRSSAGMTFRRRSSGPSRRTPAAVRQSARLSLAAAQWREFTPDVRRQWNEAAEFSTVPGYPPGLSGFNLFCACAVHRLEVTSSLTITPEVRSPGTFLTLETPVQVGTSSTFNMNWSRTTPISARVEVRATSPHPPYLSETRNPTYRFIGNVSASPFVGPLGGWGVVWWSGLAGYSGQAITWEFRIISDRSARSEVHRRTTILT